MATETDPNEPEQSGVKTPKMATMREALTDAIAAARWLSDADAAALQLAYFLADQVDQNRDTNDERLFLQVLEQLGLTTKARRGEKADTEQTPLDILRKKAARIPNPTTRSQVKYN
jgi:hypothetical protein